MTDLAGSYPVDMKPIDASGLATAVPLSYTGNYKAEVVQGPRRPLAIYDSTFDSRGGRRLLVLKLDHYGDFVIGLPALKMDLAASRPIRVADADADSVFSRDRLLRN